MEEQTLDIMSQEELERGKQIQTDIQMIAEVVKQVREQYLYTLYII